MIGPNGNLRIVENSYGKKRIPGGKTLSSALGCKDELFLDFIGSCLKWDPKERLTPSQGLHHDWICQAIY
jgi:dual specificity tyrosine-phosphorylation-regulated kinase 2/3/4